MKYLPASVAQLDLSIAAAPYLGGEFNVFLSRTPAYKVGNVELTASGTGTYAAERAVSLPGAGCDLQMVATSELRSPSGNCVVTLDVTDENNVARTLTFTFAAPARAENQDSSFPRGMAVDGVLSGGSLVKAITGLKSVVNGERNVTFGLYQLPEADAYVHVGCTTEKKFTTKSRKPVGIDCGMESDRYIKRGKTGKGDLTLDSKFGGMADKLTRFDGAKTTAMLVGLKDGQVTCDRIVFVDFTPGVEVNLPDGEGEAMENAATGKYMEALYFVAG